MKKLFLILLFITNASLIKAQVELAEQNNTNNKNMFYQDLLNFPSSKKDLTRVDVYLQIPYKSIQFLKSDKQFTGSYTTTISIFNKKKNKLIEEKIWKENITTGNFHETISKDNFSLTARSFYLSPGKYTIRTSVEDIDSKRDYTKKVVFNVRNMKDSLSVSDILLISKYSQEKGKKKVIPNISRNVANIKNGLPFFFEVYSSNPRNVNIQYAIYDNHNKRIFYETERKNINKGENRIFHIVHDSSFSLGNYKLSIDLKNKNNVLLASVQKRFFSQWVGVPSTVRDLGKAIKEMVYIASPSAIDSMQEAKTKDEKLKLFLAFWKKIDPTPNTQNNPVFDEYFRRVAYANAHFTQYIKGWRTDRGMVFILLGPPNSVDRHPFDIDSKPYVVWEYYSLNRNFVFVDETGFGDYRLVTPLTGDLYRFRYNH
ncbi:MAG TPA: GWxTD domain-containing protein [Ignavibacteria bacterium]|nr:GWxTD domain-containing protein [Ignavibacteria bacterium]